jgi:23S rRNA G2069 N7-methylase RlmK/C1962 C5-methylase RlmI
MSAALPLLKPAGVLFASTNAAAFAPEDFLRPLEAAIEASRRNVMQRHYFPQPPDFPISKEEPGYLKTIWYRIR